MATGRGHDAASLLLTPVVGAALLLTTRDPLSALVGAIGCTCGMFLSPDTDQEVIVHAGQKTLVTYIPVLGWWWLGVWDIYARIFPHRHFLTHFPVVGTVGRWGYLRLLEWLLNKVGGVTLPAVPYLFPFWVGVGLSDLAHWVMDGCPVKWGEFYWDVPRLARVWVT